MKKIAYVAVDNGMDGMDKSKALYASFSEDQLTVLLNADKSKAYRSTAEVIVDIESARRQALSKLDGIDRLVLNLPAWPSTDVPAPAEDVRGADRDDDLRLVLDMVNRYLADLNNCAWIKGVDPGSIDMRQRAKALHRLVARTILTTTDTKVG